MDQFCISENESGGSCACSDLGIEYDKQFADIQKIMMEAERVATEEVEKVKAGANADIIFTDVWASMGQESEAEKRKIAFRGYQVNDELLGAAHSDCMVQHCLPAHRGEEITEKVFEAHANEIFDEAENRLHAQKAVLVKLMANQ